MAFIFVPNADGSFTEGDKQTNPDTGVEYIYIDGAWRALGPKIEDEFDTLDERYVKLTGTTRTTGSWRIKGDNETGDGEQTFQSISGGSQRLYYIETPEDDNVSWVANVEYVQQKIDAIPPVDLTGYATESYVNDAIDAIPDVDLSGYVSKDGTQTIGTDHWKIIQPNQDGNNRTFVDIYDGSMNLYNVADPTDGADGWATNKKYVKDNFIGNNGTQTLNEAAWNLRQTNSSGNYKNFIAIHDGEMHLYNVADPTDGSDGWAVNKGYVDTLFSSSGGGSYLPLTGGDLTGRIDITLPSANTGNAAIRTIGSINVKGNGQELSGSNNFIAHKDYVRVYSTPTGANDVTHKGFTDSTYRKKTAIPGLIFAYESGSSGTVATGKFRWYTDGGGKRLKINATTKDGIPWGVDTPVSDINYSEGHMFSIYTTVSNTNNWRIKQTGTINRIDFHANDILCYVSFSAENGSFSTSAEYGITISGLF